MQKILNISQISRLIITYSRGCKFRARVALRRQAPNTGKPFPIIYHISFFRDFSINYSNFTHLLLKGVSP